eukprot:jgi/Mesen1/10949/ME000096S10531
MSIFSRSALLTPVLRRLQVPGAISHSGWKIRSDHGRVPRVTSRGLAVPSDFNVLEGVALEGPRVRIDAYDLSLSSAAGLLPPALTIHLLPSPAQPSRHVPPFLSLSLHANLAKRNPTPRSGSKSVNLGTCYDESGFTINGTDISSAVICSGSLALQWSPASFFDITVDRAAADRRMEPDVKAYLLAQGIKIEAIATRNAASTFNILSEEGRKVAAALLTHGAE